MEYKNREEEAKNNSRKIDESSNHKEEKNKKESKLKLFFGKIVYYICIQSLIKAEVKLKLNPTW